MPDPRLTDAMAKISAICRQYDIAVAITVVSQTHAEFRYQFPTWSAVQPERGPDGGPGIRLRSYEVYYRYKNAHRQAMEASLHCLYQIRDIAAQTFIVFDALTSQLEASGTLDIDHHPDSGVAPHKEDHDAPTPPPLP